MVICRYSCAVICDFKVLGSSFGSSDESYTSVAFPPLARDAFDAWKDASFAKDA
jgi:hypothetical protein